MAIPKKLLQQYNIRPCRRLGQNFLIDKNALGKIIQTADLSPNDVVLEVGPGLGVLTLELTKHVKKVIAVEKDKRMIEILKNVLNDRNVRNVEIIEGDILKLNIPFLSCPPESFDSTQDKLRERSHNQRKKDSSPSPQNDKTRLCDYKIIANIPYYLTSPLIRKFLETTNQPKFIVLMLQKEVAQRICAKPPKMTLLSVATQFYAEPKIISSVSKKAFWPQPKVDSAIIKITPFNRRPEPPTEGKESRRKESKLPAGSLASRTAGSLASGLRDFSVSTRWRIPQTLTITKEFQYHFFRVVRAAFSQPRKQLVNNLSKGLSLSRKETKKILLKAELQPTQRPSELSVDKYMEIAWIIWGK